MSRYDEEFDDVEDFDEDEGHYVVIERGGGGAGIGTFLLGAAIGAGIALLFAPQSGAGVRRRAPASSGGRGMRRMRRRASRRMSPTR
jgi:hypothetical protein